MKTVLVTGGCGFIGSHFVRLLLGQGRWRVVNVDLLTYAGHLENLPGVQDGPAYRFVRGDIADASQIDALFRDERPWAAVNFAAESHVDRSILDAGPFLRTNVGGVHALLEAVRRHRTERFVQISSDEVYGDADGRPASDEAAPLRPSSPYAASKAAADLLCLAFARTYGTPVVIARSANNFGPFQYPEKLIPVLCRNALGGQTLPVYGDGLQRRDWLYVEDNVSALFAILERGRPGAVYNVATGEERTNLDVVRSVCDALARRTGTPVEAFLQQIRHVPDRPGHDRRYALATARIRDELGWRPRVTFEDALRRTLDWYVDHQEWVAQVTSGEDRAYYDAVYTRRWERAP